MQSRAAFALWMIVFQVPVFVAGSDLKRATISELETLGRLKPGYYWEPRFWDILVPENHAQPTRRFVPVPGPVKQHVLSWTRKVVKPEWLPAKVDQLMVGLRDVKQDSSGLIPTGWTADLVLVEYGIEGFSFHLVENGLSLSIRVDMPQGVEIRDDQQSIAGSLKRFLNLNPPVFAAPYSTRAWWSPLFYGVLEPDEPRRDPKGRFVFEWWDSICFASDGSFLFVSIREARDGVWRNVERDWQPRLPDRF